LYENLRQHKVRGLRADCLFGGDSLSTVQVGFEADPAGERGLCAESLRRTLIFRATSSLLPDILIPQICARADEVRHHLNALIIVEYDELDASFAK
jgi:hypothetical protein